MLVSAGRILVGSSFLSLLFGAAAHPISSSNNATAATTTTNTTPCCVSCSAVPGQEKYYSIDSRHNSCGECCMDPADYDMYKRMEPGLEKATTPTPCSDLNYTKYTETVTHGAGSVTMTLDLYDP